MRVVRKWLRPISTVVASRTFPASIVFLCEASGEACYLRQLVESVDIETEDKPDKAARALSQEIYRRSNVSIEMSDLNFFEQWDVKRPRNIKLGNQSEVRDVSCQWICSIRAVRHDVTCTAQRFGERISLPGSYIW